MPGSSITSDPNVMMGKPVVSGTRITVELILEKLAAGETPEQILSEHPRLTAEGIRAAMAFAAATLREDVPHKTLNNAEALTNAAASGAGYFKVPKVIDRS